MTTISEKTMSQQRRISEAVCEMTKASAIVDKQVKGLTIAEWLAVYVKLSEQLIQEQLKEERK